MTNQPAPLPERFIWGTSTSAYQIEGNSVMTDWWRFERAPGTPAAEVCGDACDSWHRYEEDLDLIVDLGLDAFRLSIEWARVEPERGVISRAALDHYRDVLLGCRLRGITTVVTLHHFTFPLWVADGGGVEHPEIVSLMAQYAHVIAHELGDLIDIACTVNEPNILALMGYLVAMFPPQVSDWDRYVRANETLRSCHLAMRDALREEGTRFPIGLPLSMQEWEARPGGEERMASLRHEMEDRYLDIVGDDDYIGVQCYTKFVMGPNGLVADPGGEMTEMGYLYWPQCVAATVRRAAEMTTVPIIVTENGIGTDDDQQRIRYLDAALDGLREVIDEGIDVRGYFQWSLLDNFEWTLGYRPKFGIVAVDRTTFERSPKPSAQWFANACATFDERRL